MHNDIRKLQMLSIAEPKKSSECIPVPLLINDLLKKAWIYTMLSIAPA